MRAVVLTGHGGPEVLQVQERPDPPVGPGEVRIAVKAAGINFADTMARVGLYPDAPKPPCVLGYEVAGEVESVGEGVDAVKAGDRVIAGTRFGGQAELVTVAGGPGAAAARPAQLRAGRGVPGQLRHRLRGAGRDGRAQAGRARADPRRRRRGRHRGDADRPQRTAPRSSAPPRPPSTTRSASRASHHPIDYRTQDFEQEVTRITDGEGVDLIIDALGPTTSARTTACCAPAGGWSCTGSPRPQTGDRPRHAGKLSAAWRGCRSRRCPGGRACS